MLQIGSLVDNKYKILSEVGRGGMSIVYLAINERANKTWAIKEVRKDGVIDFEAVKQGLVVETDMLKKLNHAYLPSIIDVIDTSDSFLIVMDYIEGTSLQNVLKSSGAQSQDDVLEWGMQICDVLGYLHSQKPPIIYRDMKPANVMLKPDGNITLIDFGTAREFKDRAMVEDTICLGTRGYAAPEQFGGRGQTDARTDIYCVGATLYHLLTGHSPAEPPYEIKPLRYWNPLFAGSGIEKVIKKCCQQDPSARYQNCKELMYALEHAHDEDDAARRVRRKKWLAFIASLSVCLLGIAGMIVTGSAKKAAETKTYSYYISQAEKENGNIEAAYDNYRAALRVDPGRPDAYERLLDQILYDLKMDDTEHKILVSCLKDTDGRDTNEEKLKSKDPKSYDELMYKIGLLYFFQYDKPSGGMAKSTTYFRNVMDSPYLNETRRELAATLYTIGGGFEQLNKTSFMDDMGDAYSYDKLWGDMEQIMSGDLQKKVGDRRYCVAVCKLLANLIDEHLLNFKEKNITETQMTNLLNQIGDSLNEMQFTEGETEWMQIKNQGIENVENARYMVNATFHGAGVENR